MNSNYAKSNQQKGSSPVSLNNYNFDFDLGVGSNRSKSLNDRKNINTSSSNSYFTSSSSSSSSQPRPAWQPNKPSWTHQPAPSLAAQPALPGGPTSMVGDIFGKSWGSTQSSSSNSNIGIANKNPNLFGDLVGSALGQSSKSSTSSNVPLKNATPISKVSGTTTTNNSSFSMGNMADSLPKTGSTVQGNTNWGSSGAYKNNSMNSNKSTNPSAGVGMSSNKDPFSSLAGFGSKQAGSLNSTGKVKANHTGDDDFGHFQNASKPTSTTFPSTSSTPNNINVNESAASVGDPLDMFFSSSSASAGSTANAMDSEGLGGQASFETDDWGLDSDIGKGGQDVGGTTTEIEGLPPPPAGVSGSTAKSKGMDNYKQGQFADAIKWLSWAIILLQKAGDNAGTVEVLSCRASCFKEVGEYKKAVADCSKVLEDDERNVSVLVQRALLYESMEKYKLGAEDLRTVLKIDPINRVARSTIHRLNKMAD